jgi:DNA-binding XRE family transcriptional regulator
MNLSYQTESFGDLLISLRKQKKISQMDLALEINISSRHLSFIETGKSKPSRNLVLSIIQFFQLPFRHSNTLLMSAGFSPEFKELTFHSQEFTIIREAFQRILTKHDPYPAFVINRSYQILMKNSGYDNLVKLFCGEKAMNRFDNSMKILFSEDGFKNYVQDFPKVETFLQARLAQEISTTQDKDLMKLYQELFNNQTKVNNLSISEVSNLPVINISFAKEDTKANFFTIISTLGTPLDLSSQELRIELLFPVDADTKNLLP